jgi:hypothetical protein
MLDIEMEDSAGELTLTVTGPADPPGPAILKATGFGEKLSCAVAAPG